MLVGGVDLHGAWIALHVHDDVRNLEFGNYLVHTLVQISATDVVDHVRACTHSFFRHACAKGVDRNECIRMFIYHGAHSRNDAF